MSASGHKHAQIGRRGAVLELTAGHCIELGAADVPACLPTRALSPRERGFSLRGAAIGDEGVAGVSESDQCSPLNDEHKTEIVMRLAAFYTPRSVIRMLAEEYGVT